MNKISKAVKQLYLSIDYRYPKLTAYYQAIRLIITGDNEYHWRESHFLKRSNPMSKAKYCIFRMVLPENSLFATACRYIWWYEWALSKGFIPIVDIEYQYSFSQHILGENNLWEYCFEQPLTVKEVIKRDYVYVRASGVGSDLKKTCLDINGKRDDPYLHVTEKNWRSYYANINRYIKKCWKIKREILDEFEKEYGIQIREARNIVGVFLREEFTEDYYKWLSDEEKKVYDEHPRVPSIGTTIEIIRDYMNKWKCEYIFLATRYQDSLERFQKEFSNKVLAIKRVRPESIAYIPRKVQTLTDKEKYQQRKQLNLEEMSISYTKEIIALSRCDYLIAAKGGGAAGALSINGGKYKDIHILSDENNINRY